MGGSQRRILAAIAMLCAWAGLALQYAIIAKAEAEAGGNVLSATWIYIAYFTILTNFLVALSATAHATQLPVLLRFARPSFTAGATCWIIVVAIVYELALRRLWNPEGWQFAADLFLHTLTPLSFFVFWLLAMTKGRLDNMLPFRWLGWPLLYLAYAMARGRITGEFAYPFIDVNRIGFGMAAINAFLVLILFLLTGYALIVLDSYMARRRRKQPPSR